jgi:hypothetical protein
MADQLLLFGLPAAGLVALLVWLLLRLRVTPAERECRRRLQVNQGGRMIDGLLTDAHDGSLYFSYTVRGVGYTTSQDVSAIERLPLDALETLIGPVIVKYTPANPANSIVVCEAWSGLRTRAAEKAATS